MKILYEPIDKKKKMSGQSALPGGLMPASLARRMSQSSSSTCQPSGLLADEFALSETNAAEQSRWLVPAAIVLFLALGSFYYYQQKMEEQVRSELEAARAEARARRDYFVALERHGSFNAAPRLVVPRSDNPISGQ